MHFPNLGLGRSGQPGQNLRGRYLHLLEVCEGRGGA